MAHISFAVLQVCTGTLAVIGILICEQYLCLLMTQTQGHLLFINTLPFINSQSNSEPVLDYLSRTTQFQMWGHIEPNKAGTVSLVQYIYSKVFLLLSCHVYFLLKGICWTRGALPREKLNAYRYSPLLQPRLSHLKNHSGLHGNGSLHCTPP